MKRKNKDIRFKKRAFCANRKLFFSKGMRKGRIWRRERFSFQNACKRLPHFYQQGQRLQILVQTMLIYLVMFVYAIHQHKLLPLKRSQERRVAATRGEG